MNNTCRSLVSLEERAADMYMNFALRFRSMPELRAFWFQMGIKYQQHALLLGFCGCEDLILGSLPDNDPIRALSDLFSGLEDRAEQPNLSVDEAFLIAGELESSSVNSIYSQLVGPVKGTPYILRKKIETLGVDHMPSLIQGARRFRISPKTTARLVELKRQEFGATA